MKHYQKELQTNKSKRPIVVSFMQSQHSHAHIAVLTMLMVMKTVAISLITGIAPAKIVAINGHGKSKKVLLVSNKDYGRQRT